MWIREAERLGMDRNAIKTNLLTPLTSVIKEEIDESPHVKTDKQTSG